MSGFSAGWLALREPYDSAARSLELANELRGRRAGGGPLEVVDLGAGTGSNLRYLAPLIGGEQRWKLVDHDQELLAAALVRIREWAEARGARAASRGAIYCVEAADFALEIVCDPCDLRFLDRVSFPAHGLVTAAALLDLVSHDWLVELADRCRTARSLVHFALTYDGRTTCAPEESGDDEALALFNAHQLGDKGFGPALGPRAAAAALAELGARGYRVGAAQSDWRIDRRSRAMQLALLDGWRAAALAMAPERGLALTAWHERRRAHLEAGRSELLIGHVDLVGSL